MKQPSHSSLLFVTLVVAVFMGLLFYSLGHASQDTERSLDIKRYPNEPLELVELKIGQTSVKNGIRFKSKESISQWGLDNVKFRDKDDWFKNVKIRLRNISGRPIVGLSASLYFKPPHSRIMFQMALEQTQPQNLKQQPLQPGHEIDLEINEGSFNQAIGYIRQSGVEANQLPVSLSVESALFSDDFGWRKGVFIRRDPNNPNKWDAVDNPAPSHLLASHHTVHPHRICISVNNSSVAL